MIPAVLEMDDVSAEYDSPRPWQLYQQRLIAWRDAWRSDDHSSSIAKHVMVALDLHHAMISFQASFLEHPGLGRPVLCELPFGFLNQDSGGGEQCKIADMIDVAIGETDVADRRRFDIELFELLRQPRGDDPVRPSPIARDAAWYVQKFVRNTRPPEKIALRMVDELRGIV